MIEIERGHGRMRDHEVAPTSIFVQSAKQSLVCLGFKNVSMYLNKNISYFYEYVLYIRIVCMQYTVQLFKKMDMDQYLL